MANKQNSTNLTIDSLSIQALKDNPREMLKKSGLNIDADTQINFAQNTHNKFYFVMPDESAHNLDLKDISAAKTHVSTSSTVGSIGTAGSVTTTVSTVATAGSAGSVACGP